MNTTIKLNKDYWKRIFPSLKYGTADPLQVFSDDEEKFSRAMKAFKINGVNKNTRSNRHKETQSFLSKWITNINQPLIILDIGASDGTTSLDFMQSIDSSYKKYYVTDYNIQCSYAFYKKETFFFNKQDNCFLVASKRFVFYPEHKWLFNLFFKSKINKIKNESKKDLLLINKDLQNKKEIDTRIKVMQYNIFEQWPYEKADLIIVGNLLHEVYFTKSEIKSALINCYNAMSENARLVVIRNVADKSGKEIEISSVYQKNYLKNRLENIKEINGGVEINDFLLSIEFEA